MLSTKANKFKQHRWNFFWQPLLAACFAAIALASLGGIKHVELLGFIGTSALGSTAFLIFSMPSVYSASSRCVIGGYSWCIIISIFFSLIANWLAHLFGYNSVFFGTEVLAALAMACTMFLMVIFRVEHPPAAGLALGLVIEPWTYKTLFVLCLVILLMLTTRKLVQRQLVDLV